MQILQSNKNVFILRMNIRNLTDFCSLNLVMLLYYIFYVKILNFGEVKKVLKSRTSSKFTNTCPILVLPGRICQKGKPLKQLIFENTFQMILEGCPTTYYAMGVKTTNFCLLRKLVSQYSYLGGNINNLVSRIAVQNIKI